MPDSNQSSLPARPSLEFLRKLAKDRLSQLQIANPQVQLARVQFEIAREHGFSSWRAMKERIDTMQIDHISATVAGVPILKWGKSGETTFCGALSAALAAIGPVRSYNSLMGDTALAFRIRFFNSDDGADVCPSSPVGEFPPHTERAANSIGWNMQWYVNIDGAWDRAEMAKRIVQSIDDGRPILAFATHLDMGVIIGYGDKGATVKMRDYFSGSGEETLALDSTRGLFAFFIEQHDMPSREKSVHAALRLIPLDWSAKPQPKGMQSPGSYYFGEQAYERWIEILRRVDSLSEVAARKMHNVNWWIMDCLFDARSNAAPWIEDSLAWVPEASRDALRRAIESYKHLAGLLGERTFMKRTAFQGPWSGKKFEDWSNAVREVEIDTLTQALALDQQAIAHIQQAIQFL